MRTIHIPMEDKEIEMVESFKRDLTWKEFVFNACNLMREKEDLENSFPKEEIDG